MSRPRYDTITEVGAQRFDLIEEVTKFNPYHDAKGRFASANSYTSFTYKPGQGAMYDRAIQREKERAAGTGKISSAEESIRGMLKDGAVVKLEGVDPEMAESLQKSIGAVLERYPSVKDAFEGFSTDDPRGDYFEKSPGAIACYDPSTQMIHLNKAMYGNRSEFDAKYKESVEKKHSPAGTTIDSVIVHEMGHAIDRYVSLKTIDNQKVLWGGERVSSRIWNNDIKNGKKAGTPVTGKSIREGLSGYASKNHHEYLAEGFAEYMTSPNPRPMATSIGKRLETYIKKAAKS